MPEPEVPKQRSEAGTWEGSSREVLAAARPLPPDEDAMIEELSEDEDRIFLDSILNA